MANVIPMSGLGSRFAQCGYKLPKPLIPVSGRPMILQVIKTLPQSDKWIFIVREEHVTKYAIDKVIQAEIPHAIIVTEKEPRGQATTCILALPHLEPEESMFIAACDNSFLYNKKEFERLKNDASIDATVWTFTKHPSLSENPKSWGWIKQSGGVIDDVSVKIPLSENPENDHAVVGAFYFKHAQDFKAACDLMIQSDHRTNGEFYVDSLPVFYKKLQKKSVIFDVDLYVGWGKPEDLYLYEEWEYRVRMNLGATDPQFTLWKEFIQLLG